MKLSIALMALLVVAAVLAAPNMGNGAADKGMIDSAERGDCQDLFPECIADSDCCSGKCDHPQEARHLPPPLRRGICYQPSPYEIHNRPQIEGTRK